MPAEWLTRSQNPWILVLITGIVSTLFGLLVIFHPWEGLTALVFLVAVAFIISGIATVLENDEKFPRSATIISGVVLVLFGVVILAWPEATVLVLAVLAGVAQIIRGGLRAGVAMNQQVVHRKYYMIMAVLNLVFGLGLIVVTVLWPEVTIVVLALLIGINITVTGIVEIAMSFELREIGRFY